MEEKNLPPEPPQKSSNLSKLSSPLDLPVAAASTFFSSSSSAHKQRTGNPIIAGLLDMESTLHAQVYVSETLLDLLHLEMVHAFTRISKKKRKSEILDMNRLLQGLSAVSTTVTSDIESDEDEIEVSDGKNGGNNSAGNDGVEDTLKWVNSSSIQADNLEIDEFSSIDKETIYLKAEQVGFRVGYSIAEKLSRDRPRFTDNLDIMKFICKDFWQFVFKKQIDNLKTNHRGVFVLQDNQFKWIRRVAPVGTLSPQTIAEIRPYLAFPCGLLKGATHNLGLAANVTAEATHSPSCTFKLEVQTAGR